MSPGMRDPLSRLVVTTETQMPVRVGEQGSLQELNLYPLIHSQMLYL